MAPTKKIGTTKSYRWDGTNQRVVAESDFSPRMQQNSYTIDEAAKQLNITPSTLRNWIKQGKIEETFNVL